MPFLCPPKCSRCCLPADEAVEDIQGPPSVGLESTERIGSYRVPGASPVQEEVAPEAQKPKPTESQKPKPEEAIVVKEKTTEPKTPLPVTPTSNESIPELKEDAFWTSSIMAVITNEPVPGGPPTFEKYTALPLAQKQSTMQSLREFLPEMVNNFVSEGSPCFTALDVSPFSSGKYTKLSEVPEDAKHLCLIRFEQDLSGIWCYPEGSEESPTYMRIDEIESLIQGMDLSEIAELASLPEEIRLRTIALTPALTSQVSITIGKATVSAGLLFFLSAADAHSFTLLVSMHKQKKRFSSPSGGGKVMDRLKKENPMAEQLANELQMRQRG